MTNRVPVKAIYANSTAVGLGEFGVGDTIDAALINGTPPAVATQITNIGGEIDTITSDLATAKSNITTLNANLSAEITNRTNADNAEVTNRNAAIAAAVAVETTNRTNADNALGVRIDNEITNRTNADSALGLRFRGRNKLINGDFRIWQRGTANYTSSGYTADRWYIGYGGMNNVYLAYNPLATADYASVQTEGKVMCKLNADSVSDASGHFFVFEQRMELVTTFSGKQITLSFTVYVPPAQAGRYIAIEFQQYFGNNGSATVSGIGSKKYQLPGGYSTITHTVTLPSVSGKTLGAGHNLVLTIWLSGGTNWNSRNQSLGPQTGQVYFTDMQLEEGAVATPFEQRPYSHELALCQRYCRAGVLTLRGTGSSNSGVGTFVTFDMRTAPVVFLTNTNYIYGCSGINVASYAAGAEIFVNSGGGAFAFTTNYLCEAEL